jgi:hypothetical protein
MRWQKLLYIIFFSVCISSCVSRKVAITKTKTEINIDSSVVEKKDSTTVVKNGLSITEDIDEVEVVPIDTTKPIIVGGKTYFNAILRIKKTKRQVIDTTKSIVSHSQEKTVNLKKQIKKQDFSKKIDKSFNYFSFLWVALVLLLVYVFFKFKKFI